MRATDAIDFDVGLTEIATLGTRVSAGDSIALVYARSEASAKSAVQELAEAITISDAAPEKTPLILVLARG